MKPPATITLKVCFVCGRTDRHRPFTGRRHFVLGRVCPGKPVAVTYKRA